MKSNLLMDFSVDRENKRIKVKREFAAPLDKLWAAWTQSELLDQWWAPKPWKSKTKNMDFSNGGHWLYAMVGPEGDAHWGRADYQDINPKTSFAAQDSFTDENGTINESLPKAFWTYQFTENSNSTTVDIVIKYDNVEDIESIIKMGFKEGFEAGLGNLDELLESQK